MGDRACRDCRFWNTNGDHAHELLDDDAEPMATDHRRCLKILHGNGQDTPTPLTAVAPAFLIDGSGYAASLFTLPGFSCSMHEPRT